jgi:hypothetical protein
VKPKLFHSLALILSGLLLGCSTGINSLQTTNPTGKDTDFTSVVTGPQGLASNDGEVIDAALKTIFEKSSFWRKSLATGG